MTICTECAKAKGWTWPEGHLASEWEGICSVCHEQRGCCSSSDWRKPREVEWLERQISNVERTVAAWPKVKRIASGLDEEEE